MNAAEGLQDAFARVEVLGCPVVSRPVSYALLEPLIREVHQRGEADRWKGGRNALSF